MVSSLAPIAEDVHSHPRPLLMRRDFELLDGIWDFAIDERAEIERPSEVRFQSRIRVPFAPETAASGIGKTGFFRACWYRRSFARPDLPPTMRLLLHFGAVDYYACVWINGVYAGDHEGGYTPFTIDITNLLTADGAQEIVVRAEDDPHDLEKPRGKQDWEVEPHSIWYPRTTGIWQTVWLEPVPRTRMTDIVWTPSLLHWALGFETWIVGNHEEDLSLELELRAHKQILARDTYAVVAHEVHREIALSDPGIDDFRNTLLWSPERPTLIEGTVRLRKHGGEVIDEIHTYTALRSVALEGDNFVLNGRPYMLRLVLDQGYWPETGMSPPSEEALRRDIDLTKRMGFNGVRKHQKLEDPRYLHWADRMGLLVWCEMPSAYRFTQRAVARVFREWQAAVRRDISHPCIVAWVPVNESWGVPNLPQNPVERHYVQALYHLTKTLDGSRPVIGNDGWESVDTDIIGIHDYDSEPERLAHRYHGDRLLPHVLKQERPGGRLLVVGDRPHHERPVVLSEFGGIALSEDQGGTWGYSRCANAAELAERYTELLAAVRSMGLLAGFCYTQFTDTFQEANGLLYADRRPKFPLEEIYAATLGPSRDRDS